MKIHINGKEVGQGSDVIVIIRNSTRPDATEQAVALVRTLTGRNAASMQDQGSKTTIVTANGAMENGQADKEG
jgi:hypothetical protein